MRAVPYLATTAAVAIIGLAAYLLTRVVALPHVSVMFLAAVVISAALFGFWPGVFAAVLSIAASSYFFYSPILSFRVSNPQDLADLAAFVIVAAFTSRLAASVRERALEARRGQESVARLLAFSERLAVSSGEDDLNASIVEHLAPVLGRPIHLLLPRDGSLAIAASFGAAGAMPPAVLAAARSILVGETAAVPGWWLGLLATPQSHTGVIAAARAEGAVDGEYARALLGHAALAIERARLRSEITDARVRGQGEALREALINSVSHDLQTPLAAILGSATALESFGEHGDARARRELVGTIREESERLAAYIENVLDLTRIRAGHLAPRLELIELSDIVNAALRRKQKALAGHEIRAELPAELPMLRLDPFLMEHALANLLDNAAKYAPAGSTIRLAAAVQNGEVMLEVIDQGRGIPAADLERVFDAFYRGAVADRPPSGTGLGLAICRAFVEANGGRVTALSGPGATLRICLPVPQAALIEASDD